ncbi:MAG: TetR/AcrR family transcriptional regulator [Pseudomonadota bacterium]
MKTPKPSDPPSAEANETRQRILRAAFPTFAEKGYVGASTLMIATRAKVSKRDLYAMFPSKEAMLVACIRSRSDRMRMPEGIPEARNREMLASTLEAFATNFLVESLDPDVIGMYRLAIAEAVRSPEIARRVEEARGANRAIVYELFVRAQTAGLLPSGDTAEMVRQYFALTSEDLILTLLLGVLAQPSRTQMRRRAAGAAAEFLLLHPPPARNV